MNIIHINTADGFSGLYSLVQDSVPRPAILLTDSRSLSFPDRSVFFALRSERNDGSRYAAELAARGVRHFVLQDPDAAASLAARNGSEGTFCLVDDTRQALQGIAQVHRSRFDLPVIGITGSNGKTICKEWLNQLLRDDYRITRSPRSYNSQIGVPLSVWQLDEQSELGIFEAGMSCPGEMERLEPIVRPTIGLFTNLGDAHQENFLSPEQKCREKLRLFDRCERLIYCADHELISRCVREKWGTSSADRCFTWGESAESNVRVLSKHTDLQAGLTRVEYEHAGRTAHYVLPFTDQASVENSLHCLAVMLCLGYEADVIALRMMQLESISLRLEVKEGQNGCIIINDAYNSDLAGLQAALDVLDRQAETLGLEKTLILSDIAREGADTAELYRQVDSLLLGRRLDHLIGIGGNISRAAGSFHIADAAFFPSTADFLRSALFRQLRRQAILLKGSRHHHFENISRRLERTAHETVLEVNLSALESNFNHFRSLLRPTTRVTAMVKAFAYGAGSVEVAKTLQMAGCDCLAVAVADEGAELRREGIHIPIIVMDPEVNALSTIIEHHLEPNIYSFHILDAFEAEVTSQGLTAWPVHIKIDSGMHRLGFEREDMDRLADRLTSNSALAVSSVFSHLAGSDEAEHDDFTLAQISYFTDCADRLAARLPHPFMRHILNSAGIERFTRWQMDMVRLGIGLYGHSFNHDSHLRNVCTLRTVILQVKHVAAGQTIGYGRHTTLDRSSRVAVIPIGYADGFDRRLSNRRGSVLVDGRLCPVLGNICMDQAMIDITDTRADVGSDVIIFGDQLPIDRLAQELGTISYEVLTSVSRRVSRVYFRE